MRVLSIDPGLVNFGVVLLHGHKVVRACVHKVGNLKDTWEKKLLGIAEALENYLHDFDVVVIENNIFGRKHTSPDNAFVQAAVAGYVKANGIPVAFMNPKHKFNFAFAQKQDIKQHSFPNFKQKSLFIAQKLLEKECVLCKDVHMRVLISSVDHLSDALCQGLAYQELFTHSSPPSSPSPND